MLIVDYNMLAEGREGWKTTYSRLLAYKDSLMDIKKAISLLGNNAWSSLNWDAHISNIEQLVTQSASLFYALDTICSLYQSCEDHLLELSEDAIVEYSHLPATFVELNEAASILEEFAFSLDEEGNHGI